MVAFASTAAAQPQAKPRPHFDFLYAQGWGTRISTYDSTLTKDMVLDPDTTVHFVPSQADLDSVRDMMLAMHFFKPHPPLGECQGTSEPHTSVHIRATLGSQNAEVSWPGGQFLCQNERTAFWLGLNPLQALIWRIIRRQPEYQALPHSRGNYL